MSTPRLANRPGLREYLAAAAVHLLRQREASYPALVTAARMTATAAADKLELARILVAQWRWVIDPACLPLPVFDDRTGHFGVFDHVLAAELTAAAARARTIAVRDPRTGLTPFHSLDDAAFAALLPADRRRVEAEELADLYEALAWWQAPCAGTSRIVFDVGIERLSAPAALQRAA